MTFGPPSSESLPPKAAVSEPPLDLPSGLKFRIRLAQDIDSANAAAGDPVRGVLASAIGKRGSADYVPSGAAVNARIVRIQHTYGQSSSMFLSLHLESIEYQGQTRPFSARGDDPVQRFRKDPVPNLRQRVELGALDRLENGDTGQRPGVKFKDADLIGVIFVVDQHANHVFPSGTEMKWLTVRNGPPKP